MSDLSDLFARAREVDIEAVAGVKLFRAGKRMRGECPICGASQGKKSGGAFSIDAHAGVFKCFGCDAGGDVVRLEQLLRGGTPKEAAERLVGGPVPGPRAIVRRDAPAADRPSSSERIAVDLWNEAQPQRIAGTLAGQYLLSRGISAEVLDLVGAELRFHPAARWGWDEDSGGWIRAPAMIARVSTQAGPTGGVHATYLRRDGRGKAALDPPKRMWGKQVDATGRPGGVWLSRKVATAHGPLVVGEGIESTLSAVQLQGRPCRAAAALSLGRLQGGWLADNWGRIDPNCIRPDPERPAFTWPDQDEVLVAVDRDMKGILIKVRRFSGGTVRRRLEGDDRARLCAGMAVAAWKAAGAKAVRAIAPGQGQDFNSELMARLAAGEFSGEA